MSAGRKWLAIGVLMALFIGCRKGNTLRNIPDTPGGRDTIPAANDTIPPRQDTIPKVPDPEPVTYIQNAVYFDINANVGGFYEALPPAYDSSEKKYPLLVFLHGGGELGNGVSDLPLILKNSLPKLLSKKKFPLTFTVNGEDFSFIIICPQFKIWPSPQDVHSIMAYAKSHYRVDESRVYLSGLSMGGGATWEYAAKEGNSLAAIVPICGASWANDDICKKIAATNVPGWAFHNKDDDAVTVESTRRYVNMINAYHPAIPIRMTLWDEGGHDAWTKSTDPAYKEEGMNIYEWMLQYKR